MQPNQGAYWRQDMPRQTRIKSCKSDHCWQVAQDFTAFCKIHLRMTQSKAFMLMQDIKTRLSTKWNDLVGMLRTKADPDDMEQVFVDDFQNALLFYRIKLSANQLETLTDAFPGRKEGNRQRIKVGRFYDIATSITHHNTLKNLKVKQSVEAVNDFSGYTGQMHRQKPTQPLEPITEAEFIAIFLKDNKLQDFTRYCREISLNGVITMVELDDILRILYEKELEGKDLAAIYEPFC